MHLLLLLLSLLFPDVAHAQGGLIGPPNQILCNRTASLSPTSINSQFQLVQGVTGRNIYICGWHFTTQSVATTQSFALSVTPGTSTGVCNGAGTLFSLTPSLSVSGTAPSADHIDYATLTSSASGQSLCVGVQNGTNISGVVYFSQF